MCSHPHLLEKQDFLPSTTIVKTASNNRQVIGDPRLAVSRPVNAYRRRGSPRPCGRRWPTRCEGLQRQSRLPLQFGDHARGDRQTEPIAGELLDLPLAESVTPARETRVVLSPISLSPHNGASDKEGPRADRRESCRAPRPAEHKTVYRTHPLADSPPGSITATHRLGSWSCRRGQEARKGEREVRRPGSGAGRRRPEGDRR